MMTDQPLVSVIIPIYKVEPYLRDCVDSIINQTYKNLEIILVDDGSPDNCPKICDEYAQQDSRIKVIHKANGGLSDARNAGMKIASADYWSFVDSDDVCHPQMIEVLMKPLIEDKTLQMSVCQFYKFVNEEEISNLNLEINDFELIDYIKFFSICWSVTWAKIYAKVLFSNMIFPVGRLHEDEFTTYKLVFNAQRIAYCNSQLYFYRQREGSIMSKYSLKRIIDVHDAFKERVEFYKEKSEWQLYAKVIVDFAMQFAICKQSTYFDSDLFQQWKKELETYSIDKLSFKQKLNYISYMLFPKMRLFISKFR